MKPSKVENAHRLSEEELRYHEELDPHRRGIGFSEIILGGQDGLVNVLGVILGVAAASSDSRLVLAAGLAATFAESVSMGAVAYTSTLADLEHYEAEKAREKRHIRNVPRIETEEVRDIFRNKGFEGDILERIVETITSDEDVWISLMLSEDFGLTPIDRKKVLVNSVVVFVAALVGSLIPLAPFFFLAVWPSILTSLGLSAAALFITGYYKATRMVGHPVKSGLQLTVIGMVSAFIGYGVGLLFQGA